jgi:hypothetical protein
LGAFACGVGPICRKWTTELKPQAQLSDSHLGGVGIDLLLADIAPMSRGKLGVAAPRYGEKAWP